MYKYRTFRCFLAFSLGTALAGSSLSAVPATPFPSGPAASGNGGTAPTQLALSPSLLDDQDGQDGPSQAWLTKMVRPCARSGNRVLC